MDFQSKEWPLHDLLTMIQTGQLSLPEFQRDFLWDPSDVADLIGSVARRWPIGSILLLEGPHPFKQKGFSGGPEPRPGTESGTLLVLDGQQRLTGLFHALMETSDTSYFIDLEALEREGDLAEAVRFQARRRFQKRYRSTADMAAAGIITPKILFSNDDQFFSWLSGLPANLQMRAIRERETRLAGLRRFVYRVPGVLLSRDIELEALAKIFEKLNRTGVPLDTFDLMVAHLYPQDFFLRQEWETALKENQILSQFQVGGLEILRLVALLRLTEDFELGEQSSIRGVRQSDVLALKAETVKPRWQRAVSSTVKAIRVFSELGMAPGLLPSVSMILAAAAAFDAVGSRDDSWSRQVLALWFWKSMLEQTYIQGVNTTVVADARDLRSSIRSGKHSESASRGVTIPSPDSLLEPIVRNRILLRGVMIALLRAGARDPVTGKTLTTADSLTFSTVRPLEAEAGSLSKSVAAHVLCLHESKAHLRQASRLSELSPEGLSSQGVEGPYITPGTWVQTRSVFLHRLLMEQVERAVGAPMLRIQDSETSLDTREQF